MEDLMFVIKCLAVTIVIVVAMQIKIGGRTAEAHAMSWIHHSPIARTLDDVAEGAVKVGHKAKDGLSNLVGSERADDDRQQASTGWFKIKTKHKRFNPPVEEDRTTDRADESAIDDRD